MHAHTAQPDGHIVADTTPIAAAPTIALAGAHQPLAQLVALLADRVGPRRFPDERTYDDASWVGYRLAELLPLPHSIKQNMLEINDTEVRLTVLQKFLRQQSVL